jgi:hypothetical protein
MLREKIRDITITYTPAASSGSMTHHRLPSTVFAPFFLTSARTM